MRSLRPCSATSWNRSAEAVAEGHSDGAKSWKNVGKVRTIPTAMSTTSGWDERSREPS